MTAIVGSAAMAHDLPPDATSPHTSDTWVRTEGGALFVRSWLTPHAESREVGSAPIVLFHDSLGSVELWRDFPERLGAATGRSVVAYDRLGFGRSEPYRSAWSPDFIREESAVSVPAICKHLGIGDFIALGHSVGGGIAIHTAARFRSRCRALITESAQSFVEERTLEGIREARKGFEEAEQFDRLKRYHGDQARWVLNTWSDTWLAPEFRSWTLAPVLPEIRCPTLVIHGLHDEFGSAAHATTIASLIGRKAQLELLADCGHVPHREQPTRVVALIQRFLRRAMV